MKIVRCEQGDADIRTFCCNNLRFFKNSGLSDGQEGKGATVEALRTFCEQGGGESIFRCCADALYGWPLKVHLTDA